MGYIADISKYQDPANINYDVFAKQLNMAICRVQDGSSTIDKTYPTHMTELTKRGVPCGAYAFVRGISISDMAVEAQDFYNRAKDFNPSFYVLDVETVPMSGMRGGINAYVAKLRTLTTKKIGLYIANNLYSSLNLDTSKADFIWVPHYGVNNGQVNSTPAHQCDLHQYTSKGRLNGYDRNLDLSRFMNGRTVEFFTGTKPVINKVMEVLNGMDIKTLQLFLNKNGFTDKNGHVLDVDGHEGDLTKSAKAKAKAVLSYILK